MRVKTFVVLVAALLLTLITTAGTASAQTTSPTTPASIGDGVVSDSSIAQDETVVFRGDGFEPGTEVGIAADGEVLGSVTADGNGEFAVELRFEDCGASILTASRTRTEGESRTVTANVEVICDEDDDDNGGTGGTGGSGSDGGGTTGNGSTSTGSTGSQLPRTGSDTTTTAALVSGVVLISVGALFVFGARNRARPIV